MKSSAHHIWWVGMLISSIILSWQSFYESDLLRYLLLSFWRSQVPTVTKKLLYRVIDLKNWHCYFIFFVHFLSNDKIMLEFKQIYILSLLYAPLFGIFLFPPVFIYLPRDIIIFAADYSLWDYHFAVSEVPDSESILRSCLFWILRGFYEKLYFEKKNNKNGWLFALPVMFWGRAKHSFLNEKYYLESCVIILLLLLIVFIH